MSRPATKGSIREMLDRIITTGSAPAAEPPSNVHFDFNRAERNIGNLSNKVVTLECEVARRQTDLEEIEAEARKVVDEARAHVAAAEAELDEARRILIDHQDSFLTEGIKRGLIGRPVTEIERKIEAWKQGGAI